MRCFWYWLDPRGCTLNSHGITVGTFVSHIFER